MGCRVPGLTVKVFTEALFCVLPWAGLREETKRKSSEALETIYKTKQQGIREGWGQV